MFEWTPMVLAVKAGDADAVRRLLEAGEPAQPSGPAFLTPMSCAALKGHVAILELLLAAGASANPELVSQRDPPDTSTLLSCAAGGGHTEAVELLLRHGADPNAREHPGGTALMVAVREEVHNLSNKAAVVRALLRGGADPNIGNNHDFEVTALIIAAREGMSDVAEELLIGGAALELTDTEAGWTALHWAAARGRLEAARVLLRHGASPDSRDDHNWNAADTAANLQSDSVLDLLLAAGTAPNLPNLTYTGWEALYRGERSRREACEALLREEQAKVESFRNAIPHIVACAAAAGSCSCNKRMMA
jgi:ankyrin repeat protein